MTTPDPFEVIAAFVDGERVDAAALKAALAGADGRDYLAELVALREVVAHDADRGASMTARPSRTRWLMAAAAVMLISLAGGYALGHRALPGGAGSASSLASDVAPQPTRVIDVAPGTSFTSTGGK